MNRYFQPEFECADPAEIKRLQSEKLVKQVQHVWNNVPYYRAKMEAKGVTPDDIHGIEDLHKLPFLSKADLKEAYPQAKIVGHRDFPHVAKTCPLFDAQKEYASLNN